jgi:hypothetical protein
MKKEILSDVISAEEQASYEAIAVELAKKYIVPEVYPYVAIDADNDNARVIGYLKAPSYLQKLMVMDKVATTGMFLAADGLRETLTLKEESDPKTYGETPDCDSYKFGMNERCLLIIEVAKNQYKKK